MSPRRSRIAVGLIATLIFLGWGAIVTLASDPGSAWGAAWFELTLSLSACTFLAALVCYVLWQPAAWRARAARAGLCLAAVFLLAALIELPALLGVVDYRRILVPRCMGGTGPHNRQLDSELVYRHLPHDHFLHQQVGDSVAGLAIPGARRYRADCQYDANGFRNAKDLDRADVVLLGDSFVEGYNVTQEEISSKHLANLLSQEVCNLALCGFGPQQELAALRRFGVPLQPKITVWFFYEGNDLDDIEAYEAMMRQWNDYASSERGYASRSFFLNILDPLAYWLDQRRWRPSELARRRTGRLQSTAPAGGERTIWFGGPPQVIDERMSGLLEKLHGILAEAKKTCDAAGIKLLIVCVPRKERVYQDLCRFDADSEVPHYQWNDLPDRLGAWCSQQGIEYFDLTAGLKAAARQGKLVYLVDDPHWSAEGHAEVAAEVAGRIEQLEWRRLGGKSQ